MCIGIYSASKVLLLLKDEIETIEELIKETKKYE